MKAIKYLIAVVALFLALPISAQIGGIGTTAPGGYAHVPFTTNSGPILVAGSFTTNLPATAAYILNYPKDGFGVFLRTGGTNAADTTNLVIVLEGVIFTSSGVTQVVDNATLSIVTPTTATALPTGYDYLTNFLSFSTTSQQEAALRRCDGIRVRSIQNTNLNSLWVSNLFLLR
jgi:hypothetical protein